MASQRSAEEVREQFIEDFPAETGKLAHDLWNRLVAAYLTWDMYRSLYMESEEQVELLNRTAGLFFNRLQTFLYQETFLSISRITDRPQTAGSDNASLRQLVAQLEPHISAEEHTAVSEAVETAEDEATKVKKYRHKMLAHRDLDATLGEADVPSIAPGEVDTVLHALSGAIDEIRGLFQDSSTHWEAPSHLGGVSSLIGALKDHVYLEETCQDHWKMGDPQVSLTDLCEDRFDR